ncbi:hypothetical protein DVH24_006127, partial [Malus domestica]
KNLNRLQASSPISFSLVEGASKASYFASSLDALKFKVSWAWSAQIGATIGSHDILRAGKSRAAGKHDFERRVLMKTRYAPGFLWLDWCVFLSMRACCHRADPFPTAMVVKLLLLPLC